MTTNIKELSDSASWAILVGAAREGLESQGYKLNRLPGRGRSNVWEAVREGKKTTISIRTSKDRWFAFPPLNKGRKWKTLDDVDQVVVAAVDKVDDPKNVEVYRFPAEEVRKRFDANYQAKMEAGLAVKDNHGMWVALKTQTRRRPQSVGSGLGDEYPPIANYSIEELIAKGFAVGEDAAGDEPRENASEHGTIADVISQARQQIAQLAGVRPESVRLDLKIEY